jgi:hypothetical protein
MQDVFEVLFPYLVALYVLDCIQFVSRHHLLLSSLTGRRFRLHRAGVYLTGILPIGRTFLTHDLPLWVTTAGLYYLPANSPAPQIADQPSDWQFISFRDLNSLQAEGKRVTLNGDAKIKLPSADSARRWVALIQKLQHHARCDRANRIGVLLGQTQRIARLLRLKKIHAKVLSGLELTGSLLFFGTFILLPLALYSPLKHHVQFNLLLVLIAAIYLATLILAFRSHRVLYLGDRSGRAQFLLSLVFSPVNAIHAGGCLTKDLYSRFDYLTLCACFLSPETLGPLIRREAIRIDSRLSPAYSKDWNEFWQLKKGALNRLLKQIGVCMADIKRAPEKQDPTAEWYCPACLTEYVKNAEICFDCGAALNKF